MESIENDKTPLKANDALTILARSRGVRTWHQLTTYVRALPYGRNNNRTDFGLVLLEEKGTCSSKHAFLKQMADLNDVPGVKLILGMYKMNLTNTPNIGNTLADNGIEYIPEAHCYLRINNKPFDFTSSKSDFIRLESDILEEVEIHPEQVASYKVEYHKAFMKRWMIENEHPFRFDELWKLREQCIANLSV